MDIKGIGHPPGMTKLTKTARIKDNTAFSEVLQLRMSQTNPVQAAGGPDTRAAFVERSEKVLDLLEGVAQALADPRKSLKDMEPLLRTMEGEARLLEAGLEGETDQGLGNVASDVSLTAHVALIKFYRGDYA